MGVPIDKVSSNFQIAHYNIGEIVKGVPRTNMFFEVSFQEEQLQKTGYVSELGWFTKNEFMKSNLRISFDNTKLAKVIFG